MRLFVTSVAVVALFMGAGCSSMSSSANLRTVSHVDLDRYMGRWNVISAVPTFLEKGKVATADIYVRRPDGKIDNVFAFRKGSLSAPEETWRGIAWVTDPATNATWKVRLLWPFTAEYRVLELAPDYTSAVVASRGGKWLWVLARETTLPEPVYADVVNRLRARDLPVDQLEKVPQPAPR